MNKKLLIGMLAFLCLFNTSKAQLAGTYSVPATYSTIGAAILDLNTQGVGGPVTILVSAGHTETATYGGYGLTASGTTLNPIVFIKNGAGANPIIYAYVGNQIPSGSIQDGVWRLVGSDFVTIDGIDIVDNNTSNPATMEYGYGLFKLNVANVPDGCQYNTIRNCNISLSTFNNAFGSGPAVEGSRGINAVDSYTNSQTLYASVTNTAGANSYNRIYSNIIRNCNHGVVFMGFSAPFPYDNADKGNDIGGNSLATGNQLINFGGAPAASYIASAVRTIYQYDFNCSYNFVTNNNGQNVNHNTTIRGIYVTTANGANMSINNNTVTMKGGMNAQVSGIENNAGSSANNNTITINNNVITQSEHPGTSFTFYSIWNSGAPYALSISGNTVTTGTFPNMVSGSYLGIYNTGAATAFNNMSNNRIFLGSFNAPNNSVGLYGVYNGSGVTTCSFSCLTNTVSGPTFVGNHTGTGYLIYNTASHGNGTIAGNRLTNWMLNSTGSYHMFYYAGTSSVVTITDNRLVGGFYKNGVGGSVWGVNIGNPGNGTCTVNNNSITDVVMGGASFIGILNSSSASPSLSIISNTIENITCNNLSYAMYGMQIQYVNNVSNNIVRNLYNGNVNYGIFTSAAVLANMPTYNSNTISAITSTGSSAYGLYTGHSSTATIVRNRIFDIQSNTSTAFGVYIASGVWNNLYHNLISGIRHVSTSNTNAGAGIWVNSSTNSYMYYNTVFMNATSTGPNFGNSALYTNSSTNLTLRNNIFVNQSLAAGVGSVVAYRRSNNNLAPYNSASNNNIFNAGTPGTYNLIYSDGISQWQSMSDYITFATPRDANSFTEVTPFISVLGNNAGFLHINAGAPSMAESGAVNVATFTDDYDLDIRQGNPGYVGPGIAPDIGADEYNANVASCGAVSGGIASTATPFKCANQTVILNNTGHTVGNGMIYQWKMSPTPGGPYSDVVGGTGFNNPNAYVTAPLALGAYYYVLTSTCTISGLSANSQEIAVNIVPNPTINLVQSTFTICTPSATSVNIQANGAVTYSWSPVAGINVAMGANVNALPFQTTIYSVMGTNAGGCTSAPVTATVFVGPKPQFTTPPVASPSLVCSAGNSTITANGFIPGQYVVSAVTYSLILPQGAPVTTLCSNGIPVTPISVGDVNDGAWFNVNIPFTFNFFGDNYTQLCVSTNGFLSMGGGSPINYNGYGNTFPNINAGRPCIGGMYGNLHWPTGDIAYYTVGTAPNRRFVVWFKDGQFWSNTGSVSFQIVMYEGTNIIESHIANTTGTQFSAEVIQNAAGNVAFPVPGRNGAYFTVVTPDAYRWTPGAVTYSWSPINFLNNPAVGSPTAIGVNNPITYFVTATGGSLQCTNTSSVSLITDLYPNVTITGSNAVCSGSNISLTANGAITYTWANTGVNTANMVHQPSVSTVYSVTGSSFLGCKTVVTQSVTHNITPTVTISGPNEICIGKFVNLTASGAGTYSWSNGAMLPLIAPVPFTTTTYTAMGIGAVGGCTNTTAKTVTVHALPTLTVIASPSNTICVESPGVIMLVASGVGVDTYSWSTGQFGVFTQVSPTVSTNYTAYVGNNATTCQNTQIINVVVTTCVGMDEHGRGLLGASLYPNPNNGEFTIELSNGADKSYEISDVTGRIVMKGASSTDKTNVSIETLANGVYYVKVQSESKFEVFKIVKQ